MWWNSGQRKITLIYWQIVQICDEGTETHYIGNAGDVSIGGSNTAGAPWKKNKKIKKLKSLYRKKLLCDWQTAKKKWKEKQMEEVVA